MGVAGVAPDARVLPLRVLDENGGGSGLATSSRRSTSPANEVSGSSTRASAAPGASSPRRPRSRATRTTLFVVAAGNDGTTTTRSHRRRVPVRVRPRRTSLCVGASTAGRSPRRFSNYGEATSTFSRRGEHLLDGARRRLRIRVQDGTSMATPHVAGVRRAASLAPQTPELGRRRDGRQDAVVDGVRRPASTVVSARRRVPRSIRRATGISDEDDRRHARPTRTAMTARRRRRRRHADSDDGGGAPTRQVPVTNRRPMPTDGCPGVGPDTDGDGWPDVFDGDAARASTPMATAMPALDDALPRRSTGRSRTAATDPHDADLGASAAEPRRRRPDRRGSMRCPPSTRSRTTAARSPQIASVSAKVPSADSAGDRGSRRPARRRCRSRSSGRRAGAGFGSSARPSRRSGTARADVKRLKRGAHRVQVSISSSGGAGTPRTKSFRVR